MGRGQLLNAYEVSPLLLKNFFETLYPRPSRSRLHRRGSRARPRARFRAPFSFRYFFLASVLTQLLFPSSSLPTPGEDGASGTSSPAS